MHISDPDFYPILRTSKIKDLYALNNPVIRKLLRRLNKKSFSLADNDILLENLCIDDWEIYLINHDTHALPLQSPNIKWHLGNICLIPHDLYFKESFLEDKSYLTQQYFIRNLRTDNTKFNPWIYDTKQKRLINIPYTKQFSPSISTTKLFTANEPNHVNLCVKINIITKITPATILLHPQKYHIQTLPEFSFPNTLIPKYSDKYYNPDKIVYTYLKNSKYMLFYSESIVDPSNLTQIVPVVSDLWHKAYNIKLIYPNLTREVTKEYPTCMIFQKIYHKSLNDYYNATQITIKPYHKIHNRSSSQPILLCNPIHMFIISHITQELTSKFCMNTYFINYTLLIEKNTQQIHLVSKDIRNNKCFQENQIFHYKDTIGISINKIDKAQFVKCLFISNIMGCDTKIQYNKYLSTISARKIIFLQTSELFTAHCVDFSSACIAIHNTNTYMKEHPNFSIKNDFFEHKILEFLMGIIDIYIDNEDILHKDKNIHELAILLYSILKSIYDWDILSMDKDLYLILQQSEITRCISYDDVRIILDQINTHIDTYVNLFLKKPILHWSVPDKYTHQDIENKGIQTLLTHIYDFHHTDHSCKSTTLDTLQTSDAINTHISKPEVQTQSFINCQIL